METLRRVLVFVAKDLQRSSPQKVQFLQTVVGLLDGADDELKVKFKLEQNRFILSPDSSPRGVPLRRPSFCPIKHLSVTEAAAIPLDVRQRGVDVGVAILLQTSNQRLLLTRRAKHLRIFPNVWVPPGGHIEPNETVLEAGLRELKEETGLCLDQDQVQTRVLGLWELDLSPSALEVSTCLWAEPRLIRAALTNEDYGQDSVRASEVSSDGSLSEVSIPVSVFRASAPDHGPDLERISTGTKYALSLWLQDLDQDRT
ncbi:nucleoside diphosphate-linked moiety X motif 17 isoform X2 [Boleophthalmus pectinirostris]|uniref:nucleoside diphosphate-linked moiety X motif 17 isoform X2 n=1 Tax=Boleophthalmus pectinirostris TaxID=150288 RepID=UPI002432EB6F|nr:nucleoside diphosphate-linked moiety X motif 17 isoform X2 [Boleophthalmus pectinirostris]